MQKRNFIKPLNNVFMTGSTVNECAKMLKGRGKRIEVFTESGLNLKLIAEYIEERPFCRTIAAYIIASY